MAKKYCWTCSRVYLTLPYLFDKYIIEEDLNYTILFLNQEIYFWVWLLNMSLVVEVSIYEWPWYWLSNQSFWDHTDELVRFKDIYFSWFTILIVILCGSYVKFKNMYAGKRRFALFGLRFIEVWRSMWQKYRSGSLITDETIEIWFSHLVFKERRMFHLPEHP